MNEENKENKENKEQKKGRGIAKAYIAGVLTVIAALVVVYFVNAYILTGTSDEPSSIKTFSKIKEAENIIDSKYIGDADKQLMSDYIFLGMVASLDDKYAAYYIKEEYDEISKNQDGYYEGIGVTISVRTEDNAIEVMSVVDEGPADKAGIEVGDIILEVDGESVEGKGTSEVVSMIKESQSDSVTMKLKRESTNEKYEVTTEKENLELESVTGDMCEDTTVGYIKISSFKAVTAEQYTTKYNELKDAGMTSLIIDLRDNPGGLVSGVCDTLRQILPKGEIVYMTDKNGEKTSYESDGENQIDIPLVVLVNENSASASEIFAGAVKDYGIGTIVGTTTYGKGIVQDVFKLSDGSVLKLTVAHYYTPNGNDIHEKGIEPDVEVENEENSETDSQLKKAIEISEKEE